MAAPAKISPGVRPSVHGRAGICFCLVEEAFMRDGVQTFKGLIFMSTLATSSTQGGTGI